jgi:hypothetical protein
MHYLEPTDDHECGEGEGPNGRVSNADIERASVNPDGGT